MHRYATWQLFAVCIIVWSTTWYAITWQLGATPPEVGVALRFGLAGSLILASGGWSGWPLRRVLREFGACDHALLALQGVCFYGVAYVCVYQAERLVPSGLVAVGYSAGPLITGVGGWLCFRTRLRQRFVVGGLLGLAGVGLIFRPATTSTAGTTAVSALGAAWAAAAVLVNSVGALLASRNARRGLPLWPCLGLGMCWGALSAGLWLALRGAAVVWPTSASWWGALAYLAVAGSVLTFPCYLTLQDRLGAGPAATVGVATPVMALVVSAALEGYRPTTVAVAGAALALFGNALMLMRPAR